jgi:dTDP-4-amino-4,6-dideoxygalactose transaminase
MDALLTIAAEHKAAIIEDAAHALPTTYKGRMIGSSNGNHGVTVLTCFSFYATKNLCTAEGGMLCGPANLIDEARIWSLHGMSRDAWKRYDAGGSWFYEVLCPGFKYNMTDIQAAIGIHQLKKLNSFHKRRKEIAHAYTERLSDCDKFVLPVEQPGTEHAWHLYPIRLKESAAISRDEFIKRLNANKIGSSVHFIPVHLHPYYRNKFSYKPLDFPVAYREYQKLISLPLFPRMSDRDVGDVLEAISEITACAEGALSLE